jgi:hypothetical protein
MRKIIISIAAAASALVVASPAAAQYYGRPAYGAPAYSAPYGNAYGYRNGGNQWAQQIQQLRYQANNLARSGRLTRAEGRDLFRDLDSAERAIYRSGRNGLSRNEARDLNQRIYRIQRELHRYSDYDGRRNRRW